MARVFGLSGEERLRRALAQAGVEQVEAGPDPGPLEPAEAPDVLLFRSDIVYDGRLVGGLLEAGDTLLTAADEPVGKGVAVAAHVSAASPARLAAATRALRGEAHAADSGLRLACPDDLAPAYDARLRKSSVAWLEPLRAGATQAVERRLFDASYKGITDLVTRFVWPAPALRVTRVLAALGVPPNAVTIASWVLVAAATLAFARGAFGLGLLAAWTMTFLDTVDGKLARVTLRSSRAGHVLDHGLDLVHPPIWYLAWALGLPMEPAWLPAALWVVLGGYLAGRLVEGGFLLAFGFENHCWRPVDARFRLITARRNPNLLLLSAGALAGRPELGFAGVAVWTAASLAFHLVRLGQAGALRARGAPVRGWQEQPTLASPPAGLRAPGAT